MRLWKEDMTRLEMGILGYLCIVNVLGFLMMGIDKWKARHKRWRISEKTLFFGAILGGSLGAWAGMYVFHHKTRHWYFVMGMPLILATQIVVFLLTSKI